MNRAMQELDRNARRFMSRGIMTSGGRGAGNIRPVNPDIRLSIGGVTPKLPFTTSPISTMALNLKIHQNKIGFICVQYIVFVFHCV